MIVAHKLTFRVQMGDYDVTRWVTRLEISQQPHTFWRDFVVEFAGWCAINPKAKWLIMGGYNGTANEVLIRDGYIPADRLPVVTLVEGGMPTIRVEGHDWAWFVQRMHTKKTVIVAPDRTSARRLAKRELGKLATTDDGTPIGRWLFVEAHSMHEAVKKMANMLGANIELRLPNYKFNCLVCKNRASLWDSIYSLLEPFKPDIFFRRERKTIVVIDSGARYFGVGTKIGLSEKSIASLATVPLFKRKVNRVLIRIPAWVGFPGVGVVQGPVED